MEEESNAEAEVSEDVYSGRNSAEDIFRREIAKLPRYSTEEYAEINTQIAAELVVHRAKALKAAKKLLATLNVYFPVLEDKFLRGEESSLSLEEENEKDKEEIFSPEKKYKSLETYLARARTYFISFVSGELTEQRIALVSLLEKAPYSNRTFLEVAVAERERATEILDKYIKNQFSAVQKEEWEIQEFPLERRIKTLSGDLRRFVLPYIQYCACRNLLIRANYRMVPKFAQRFSTQADFMDLLQVAYDTLIETIDAYNPEKGKLSTLAYRTIPQGLVEFINDEHNEGGLPQSELDLKRKIYKTTKQLTAEMGRPPESDELASALGISLEKLAKVQLGTQSSVSLQETVNGKEGSEDERIDLLADENGKNGEEYLGLAQLKQKIREGLSQLELRTREILTLRLGLEDGNPKTEQEVGNLYLLSKERIRQIENGALEQLKKNPQLQHLAYALGWREEPRKIIPQNLPRRTVSIDETVEEPIDISVSSQDLLERLREIDQERETLKGNYNQVLFEVKKEVGVTSKRTYTPEEADLIAQHYKTRLPPKHGRPKKE